MFQYGHLYRNVLTAVSNGIWAVMGQPLLAFFLLILKLKNVLKYQTLYSTGSKLFRKAKLCRWLTKIDQKTKICPKKLGFLRITASLNYFLVTLTLEMKCHTFRHNINNSTEIYQLIEKKGAHFDSQKIRFF